MLIKDIKPIWKDGAFLLNKNGSKIITERIEGPLQKPCQLFREKMIQTIMSSANKNNILTEGQSRKEKEDVPLDPDYPRNVSYNNFVGVGYAWIMINYDSLSIENKNVLFNLEQDLGENCIWFTQEHDDAFRLDAVLQIWSTGRPDYDDNLTWDRNRKKWIRGSNDRIDEQDEVEENFRTKAIYLGCPDGYPTRNIFLRMPIDGKTTDEEVEEYFAAIAEKMKDQREHAQGRTDFVQKVPTPMPKPRDHRTLGTRLKKFFR